MNSKVKCTGKTAQDCWACGKWHSSHSLHFCRVRKIKISTVSCHIGGNRTFDENDERID